MNSAASLRHKDYVSLTGCKADYQLIQAGYLFSRLPGVCVPSFPIMVDLTLKCGNKRDIDQLQSVTVPGMTEAPNRWAFGAAAPRIGCLQESK